jgi:hypothetical protein
LIPNQKVSPIKFGIEDGRLVLADQPAAYADEDSQNIDNARGALLKSGETLISELQQSNCDPRLLSSIKELRSALESRDNVVQLGLINIGCDAMRISFEGELPSATHAMIKGLTTGVALYVAQFPEWQRFSDNAAAVNLGPQDIDRISATARATISKLESDPSLADPAVPRTIAALLAFASDPKNAAKRTVFAVLRTLENLVARAFQFTLDFVGKTASKTSEAASTAISKVVAIGIMSVAVSAALGLSGVSAGDAMNWMKNAAEIVQRQIENLKKVD